MPGSCALTEGAWTFVLDTVSATHHIDLELSLLKRDGTLCLVGIPETPSPIAAMSLVAARRRLAGSAIGGLAETQEMLEFCAEKGIAADIEVVGSPTFRTPTSAWREAASSIVL
jgi:uncharacterized zinc-type alcohol dehydrogenase-like protein